MNYCVEEMVSVTVASVNVMLDGKVRLAVVQRRSTSAYLPTMEMSALIMVFANVESAHVTQEMMANCYGKDASLLHSVKGMY